MQRWLKKCLCNYQWIMITYWSCNIFWHSTSSCSSSPTSVNSRTINYYGKGAWEQDFWKVSLYIERWAETNRACSRLFRPAVACAFVVSAQRSTVHLHFQSKWVPSVSWRCCCCSVIRWQSDQETSRAQVRGVRATKNGAYFWQRWASPALTCIPWQT